jgi:electron transfer flavoprotein alpha subunit
MMKHKFDQLRHKNVWVVVEHQAGIIKEVTLEMLWEAMRIANNLEMNLCAVIIGNDIAELVNEIKSKGVQIIYAAQEDTLTDFDSDPIASVLVELIDHYSPLIVLIAATPQGNELAVRVATRLRLGLISGCTELEIDNQGTLKATRPLYDDLVYSTLVWKKSKYPRIATIKPGAIGVGKLKSSNSVSVVDVGVKSIKMDERCKTIAFTKADPRSLDLSEGDVVLAGGYGAKSQQSWQYLEDLADVLGAVIGGTRRALDNDKISRKRLIGLTGKTIKPKLYMGLGISGAIHHAEGMKDSEHIIAINKDATAPIFKLAHLSVVADLDKLLPLLINKVIQYSTAHFERDQK